MERVVAGRLVPHDELLGLVERLVDRGHGVCACDVADEFDVPVDVAQRALELLADEAAV